MVERDLPASAEPPAAHPRAAQGMSPRVRLALLILLGLVVLFLGLVAFTTVL